MCVHTSMENLSVLSHFCVQPDIDLQKRPVFYFFLKKKDAKKNN